MIWPNMGNFSEMKRENYSALEYHVYLFTLFRVDIESTSSPDRVNTESIQIKIESRSSQHQIFFE